MLDTTYTTYCDFACYCPWTGPQ